MTPETAPDAPDAPATGTSAQTAAADRAAAVDALAKIAGLVVATALGAVFAVYEAFLAPLRLVDPSLRLPVSLLLALVGNPALIWFAYAVTGRRLAALMPAGAWCVVWIMAAGRTTEGDLVITDKNWVGLVTLFTGPLAFAVGFFVATLRPPGWVPWRPVSPPPSAPGLAPEPTER